MIVFRKFRSIFRAFATFTALPAMKKKKKRFTRRGFQATRKPRQLRACKFIALIIESIWKSHVLCGSQHDVRSGLVPELCQILRNK